MTTHQARTGQDEQRTWIGREARGAELRCRDRGFDDRDLNEVIAAVDERLGRGVRLLRLDLRAFEPVDTRVLAVLLYAVRRCAECHAALIVEVPRDLKVWAELMHVDIVLGSRRRRPARRGARGGDHGKCWSEGWRRAIGKDA